MGKRNRAAVVVLGDLGRSPRMQYHALSLASQAGLEVDVIAYSGSEPHPDLIGNPRIHLHLMNSPLPQGLPRILYLIVLPVKLLVQTFILVWILVFRIPAPDFFLLQNPPSIPTFTVVRWACWLRKAAFIIDWHNFGYTLLGMSLGARHPLVKAYSWYERKFGRSANGHICVTKAMQQELQENWDIQATVLYDRAPGHFRATAVEEKHELFHRLGLHPGVDSKGHSEFAVVDDYQESTLFSTSSSFSIALKENRPALIISSTSWTADEDFGMLLEAAVCYDRRVSSLLGEEDVSDSKAINGPFPCLYIIVTGKGPLREEYERRIQKLRLRRVTFQTMWVSSRDYPLLLGKSVVQQILVFVCIHLLQG